MLGKLRAEGMAILLVEHDMDFVMNLTDHLVVMAFGAKIAEGTPGVVQKDPAIASPRELRDTVCHLCRQPHVAASSLTAFK